MLWTWWRHSWCSGDIPEVYTDAYLNPVPKPHKNHKLLKGHRIIVVQNVIGKIPEKIVARRIAMSIEHLLPQGMGDIELAGRHGLIQPPSLWRLGKALRRKRTHWQSPLTWRMRTTSCDSLPWQTKCSILVFQFSVCVGLWLYYVAESA